MWPFRNRSSRQGGGAAANGGPAAPAPSAGPPGWATLPTLDIASAVPVQRMIATDQFEAELPSRQATPFLGTLGHAVADEGPAGVIGGLLTPASAPVFGGEPTADLAVARTPRPAPDRPTISSGVMQRAASSATPTAAATVTSAATIEVPPPPAADPMPVWRVPVVDDPTPPSRSLTTANRPAALPVVQLTAMTARPLPGDGPPVADQNTTPSEPAPPRQPPPVDLAPANPPAGTSGPLLGTTPLQRAVDPVVSRTADGPPPASPTPPPAPEPVARPPRKLGLGAPLTAPPIGSLQRTLGDAAVPAPAPGRAEGPSVQSAPLLAQRAIAEPAGAALPASGVDISREEAALGDVPSLIVARVADAPAGGPTAPLADLPAPLAAPGVMALPTPDRPVLGQRPLSPTPLQRAVDSAAESAPPAVDGGELSVTAAPASNWAPGPSDGRPALSAAPAAGGMDSAPLRRLAAATVQRSVAVRSVPGSPGPAPSTSPAALKSQVVHAALSNGSASLDVDGAVVFAPPAWADSGPAPAAPAVQRAVDEPVATPPPPSEPATTTAAAPPGAPPAPAGGAAAGLPVDELAARLYDRIHDRLRAEFRLDRERRGRVTDLAR